MKNGGRTPYICMEFFCVDTPVHNSAPSGANPCPEYWHWNGVYGNA